jgi:hypothetical protein
LIILCHGYGSRKSIELCFHLNQVIFLRNTIKHYDIGIVTKKINERLYISLLSIYARFEPLFDTLRGSSRDSYFTPAQRSRLVYDCLLRTPFDVTLENEIEERQGE